MYYIIHPKDSKFELETIYAIVRLKEKKTPGYFKDSNNLYCLGHSISEDYETSNVGPIKVILQRVSETTLKLQIWDKVLTFTSQSFENETSQCEIYHLIQE